ncbi:Gfo/Idh/MocA family protein [Tengunoibacter tsumagoiensis]|uniref:Oxidoreductase n=1 Tax=Tengunoibacter tsumagoiensis TaxID=2014871 RepID=A0A402A958_9CHLR|nr:Gfo/Idh/MocA family oxidoreductase [Tengunoibacter tsumagoiensis]GCE15495.1 oxidoreductase [Tengunoibacter tsumagoiensis]
MMQERKVRTVLVGCGSMSSAWLEAIRKLPEVEIVSLVDIFEEAARKKASDFHLTEAIIARDLASVLEQTEVDAVFNCTIPDAHYEVTMMALQHGCHVLSEKPLADSMEHAKEMLVAAQRAGKIFSVIQNRRYEPATRQVKHFLEQKTIGNITMVNSDFYIGAHFGGFRDHMKHVLLLDMAIHTFDIARFLIGADPVSVYCKEWNPQGSWYDQDASAIAIFTMVDGTIYTYRGSWCAEGLPTTWECDWRIVGEKGTLTWDGGKNLQAQVIKETGNFISAYQDIEIPVYEATNVGGHAGLIREFFECIQNGTQPETKAADNIKSLAMVFGAIESAETGQTARISW